MRLEDIDFRTQDIQPYMNDGFPLIVETNGRAAVLIAAAQIDETLTVTLKCRCPKSMNSQARQDLFGLHGPLGTFASKISLAYFLRIIDKETFQSLEALRTLRNDAAHLAAPFDLETHVVKKNAKRKKVQFPDILNLGPGWDQRLFAVGSTATVNSYMDEIMECKIDDKPMFKSRDEAAEAVLSRLTIVKELEQMRYRVALAAAIACLTLEIIEGGRNVGRLLGSIEPELGEADGLEQLNNHR